MKSLKTNFWLDVLVFAGTLVALQPRMTGIAVHEWFALAAAVTLVLHIVLHWDWVVSITKKFFSNLFHVSRLNYLVDGLLFVIFTVTMTSGLVISRVVMPTFGLQTFSSQSWLEIHNTSANLTLLLVALHFALHWSWVRNTFNRLVIAPFQRRCPQTRHQLQSLPIPMNNIKVS